MSFSREFHNSKSLIQSICHSCPGAPLDLENVLSAEQSSTISRILPLWCLPCLKDPNSELEAPTSDHPWSPPILIQHLSLSTSKHVTPLSMRAVMNSGRFSSMQSCLTSTNDHSCYNKFSTWRSCSYSNPSIPPPSRHPCQVCIIFLLESLP